MNKQVNTAQAEEEMGTLKINFARFVAEERRNAVIALAHRKYYQDGENDDNLLKVFMALVAFEGRNQHFYTQLSAFNAKRHSYGFDAASVGIVKLQGATVTELKDYIQNMSEAKIMNAFRLLSQDSANIV